MNAIGTAPMPQPNGILDTLRSAWRANAPLTLLGIAMIISLALTIIGVFADPRVITGQPAWLKPAKFAISIAIYSFTFVWLLGFVQGRPRLKAIAAWLTTITLTVEFVIIALQAARGTTSHFNFSTALDGALFSIMAVAIVLTWLAGLLLAGLLSFQRLPDGAMVVALRMGVVIGLIGMAMAFAMTVPTGEQEVTLVTGQDTPIMGAHSVGVADGGPGLPIVGWSTVGGDYRVAHFLGLHAMQVLPLLVFVLARFGRGMGEVTRSRLLWVASFFYAGIVFITFWQAGRGQPLIAPDAATLTAAGVLIATSVVAAGIVLRTQARNATLQPNELPVSG
ncbi:MAG: hypothetical protein SF123_22555 [Chloroflexota bacterium]|nr:hypothetical protein [Chloroflexota bacterium]